MNLELTMAQHTALRSAIVTRVKTIGELIDGWVKFPDEHSDFLIKTYTKELEALKEVEAKIY